MSAMRVFNLNEPQFEYDPSDPEPNRAGIDRFGPKIGASRLGGSGASDRCCPTTSGPRNGGRPVSASYRVAPTP
jgi:hypothetical protein